MKRIATAALLRRVSLIFGVVMGFLYIIAGALFFYYAKLLMPSFGLTNKKAAAVVVVLYGFFRFYKVYRKYNEHYPEDEDNE